MTDLTPDLWYLSFAADDGWLGFCMVRAVDETLAVMQSHALGINPGGEVLFWNLSSVGVDLPDHWIGTLWTTEDDLLRYDAVLGGSGALVRLGDVDAS